MELSARTSALCQARRYSRADPIRSRTLRRALDYPLFGPQTMDLDPPPRSVGCLVLGELLSFRHGSEEEGRSGPRRSCLPATLIDTRVALEGHRGNRFREFGMARPHSANCSMNAFGSVSRERRELRMQAS